MFWWYCQVRGASARLGMRSTGHCKGHVLATGQFVVQQIRLPHQHFEVGTTRRGEDLHPRSTSVNNRCKRAQRQRGGLQLAQVAFLVLGHLSAAKAADGVAGLQDALVRLAGTG